MPNNNNKTNTPRQPAANRAVTVNSRRKRETLSGSAVYNNSSLVHSAVEDVCAITNPFCDSARNSKWPDESASQTLAVPVRMRINLTTDANGNCGTVFTASYLGGILPGGMTTGPEQWDWEISGTGFALENYMPGFDGTDQFRVVSAGVRVTPVTSAMNSQGIINVIELPPADEDDDYAAINTAIKSYPSYESLPLKSHDSLYAIMRPNGPEARNFHFYYPLRASTTSAPAGFSTRDWTSILVSVAGGAANSLVAVVDVYMNFEIMIKGGNSLGYITTSAPRSNPAYRDASTAVTSRSAIMRGTDRSIDESFMSKAFTALKDGGAFVGKNFKTIANVGAAAAHLYYGNAPAATGHLMMLADRPRDVD